MVRLYLFIRFTHLPKVSFRWYAYLLAGLLLTNCSSARTVTSPPRTIAPTASTIVSRATPLAPTGPAPVTTPLASPPQNCPLRPPPKGKDLDQLGDNLNVHLVGNGPFWIYGFNYQSVLRLSSLSNQQWPETKLVVEVGPNYNQPVTLRIRSMQTGVLAWWTDGQTPPGTAVQTLVLNPQTDLEDVGLVPGQPDIPHGPSGAGWKEWGIFPLFEAAGCYALQVSWSGGSWQSIFAVGS
jgi:hypothetical protein